MVGKTLEQLILPVWFHWNYCLLSIHLKCITSELISKFLTTILPLNNIVSFKTSNILVEYRNSDSTLGINGAIIKYYASGWKDFGITGDHSNGTTKLELLPVKYSFKLLYNNSSQQISNHNTSNAPIITFYDNTNKSAMYDGSSISENDDLVNLKLAPNPFNDRTTI